MASEPPAGHPEPRYEEDRQRAGGSPEDPRARRHVDQPQGDGHGREQDRDHASGEDEHHDEQDEDAPDEPAPHPPPPCPRRPRGRPRLAGGPPGRRPPGWVTPPAPRRHQGSASL